MTTVRKIVLDTRAERYVRDQLRSRLSLARFVAQENLRFTIVYALIGDPSVSPTTDFEHALGSTSPPGDVRDVTVAGVSELLSSLMADGRCQQVLFENLLARASDQPSPVGPGVVFCGEEVYIKVTDATVGVIADAIKEATSYPEVLGIGSRYVFPRRHEPGCRVDLSDLSAFAHEAVVVVLGAYDGDAFLVAEIQPLS